MEALLSSEVLSFYGDFYNNLVFQKYVDFKKQNFKVTAGTFIR